MLLNCFIQANLLSGRKKLDFINKTSFFRLHAAAALAVFCFNSQKNIDQIQEAIGKLTKSAMDELIDSKHPAYRYDAAFG